MEYRLYVYRSKITDPKAPSAVHMGRWLRHREDEAYYERMKLARWLRPFSVEDLEAGIRALLPARAADAFSCGAIPLPAGEGTVAEITTSYEKRAVVLPAVKKAVREQKLILYDWEQSRCIPWTKMREPTAEIVSRRLKAWEAVLSPHFQIELWPRAWEYDKSEATLLLVPKKGTVAAGAETLWELLQRQKEEQEAVRCEEQCFRLQDGKYFWNYAIHFLVASDQGGCERWGWMEEGKSREGAAPWPSAAALRRQMEGFSEALKRETEIRLHAWQMHRRYPNPVERLYRCMEHAKRWEESGLEMCLRADCRNGGQLIIRPYVDGYSSGYRPGDAVLVIEDPLYAYLLVVIEDFFPYIWDRFYEINPFPMEMWRDILKRIRMVRDLVKTDPYSPKLRPYIERCDLLGIANELSWEDADLARAHSPDFVYRYREKIVLFYDLVLDWLEHEVSRIGPDGWICTEGP